MSVRVDLTGRRFGKLTVVGFASSDGRRARWNCACDCGGATISISDNLMRGHTTACGCTRSSTQLGCPGRRSPLPTKKAHPLYQTWREMHRRCNDPRSTSYPRYGAKGVTVCPEWSDFWTFVSDMGARPSEAHQIDRVKASDPYSAATCRWATKGENSRNRDFVKLNDETAIEVKNLLVCGVPIVDIARQHHVSPDCIGDIKRGRTWKHVGPNFPRTTDGAQPQGPQQ